MHSAATPVVRGGALASEPVRPASPAEARRTPTVAKRAALVGWLALSGYAALKAHWALGGTLGITDVAEWRSFLATLTPTQLFLAFWGTVAIDAIGAALLHALLGPRGRGPGRGVARRIVRIAAVAAALVMGTAALASLVMTAGPLLGLWRDPDAFPLAPWVGLFVYSCFAVFALSLAATTWFTRERAKPRSRARSSSGGRSPTTP